MTYWYHRIATRIVIYTLIFGVGILVGSARAEQLDPKRLTEQIATQYVKGLVDIQHFNLGIELPDQLDVGLKHTRYQFDHGGAIKIKNRSPDDVTYSYQQGNHSLEITQHTIGYRFEKRFNWVR